MQTEGAKSTTPIAVIGLGCRLPGGIASPAQLWSLLEENRCGHGPVPTSRYNVEGFYHPDPERPGSIHSNTGYFLDGDTQAFENAFFGINNMEVQSMDPQQRKLLEVVYESFEDAGASFERLNGSKTGVYVGNFTNDQLIMQYQDAEYFTRYSATGSGPTLLSNRITHAFDLRGPSMTLDTACSSSLYALHLACQAIDAGDCDGAVVASANLIQSPEQQLIAVKAGILSPDAFCHTFDKSANGYGRAEGVVSIYLKRLDHAMRDGDSVRAVIKGTAVNGNGKTQGISQPSIAGQEEVIRCAYERACLRPEDTVYVEAHGTGTKVGDPIEVKAISQAFRSEARPILIGGLKPSLGHSEGASGISSLMKVVLSLEHGMIPATIGISEVNPSIEYEKWKVEIATENKLWPRNAPLRASVNSFGFGGANSHAILEAASPTSRATNKINGTGRHLAAIAAPPTNGAAAQQREDHTPPSLINGHHQSEAAESQDTVSKQFPVLLTLSAKSPISLERNAVALSNWVASHAATIDLADLEYTLNHRRSLFTHRTFALQSKDSLADGLNFVRASEHVISGDPDKPLSFIFTGQGVQWSGMGRELMQYTVFSNCIKRLDHCLQQLPHDLAAPWSLENLIIAADRACSFDAAAISQPLCTAIQIALVDLLREWNISPKTVVGHSSGEIAAAYAAGFLTAEHAMLSAYVRGYVTARITKLGAMAAVGLSEEDTQLLIREFEMEHSVAVACINSPESTTISGDFPTIDTIVKRLKDRNVFARTLKTGGRAYHSFHMKEIGPLYEDILKRVWSSPKASKSMPSSVRPLMISSVSGHIITEAEVVDPSYWRSNLESPVQFRAAVTTMIADHFATTFVEVGPHAALELPIQQIAASVSLSGDKYTYQSALFRKKDAIHTILSLCGTLFQHGFDGIDYTKISTSTETHQKGPRLLHDLPPYAWDYTDTIKNIEPRLVREFRDRRYPRHDLLGSQIPGGSRPTIAWRNILDVHEVRWLKDHCLGPSIVFPAAGYIAIAIEAICQANNISLQECPGVDLRRLNFLKALDLHADHKPRIEIVTELRPKQMSATSLSDRWWELSVSTLQEGTAQETIHVTAVVALMDSPTMLPRTIKLPHSNMEYQRPDIWYDKFTKEGLRWGPQFAVMDAVYTDRSRQNYEAAAGTTLQCGSQSSLSGEYQYIAHPVSIDGMLQTAFVATTAGWVRELRATVPVSMERVQISAPALFEKGETSHLYDTKSEKTGFGTVNIDAELYDTSDRVLVRMSAVRCIPYQGKAQDLSGDLSRKPLARVVWKPDITKAFTDTGSGLKDYVDWYAKDLVRQQISIDPFHDRLAACLDLVVHKQPRVSVVYVGTNTAFASLCKEVLRMQSPLRRCSSFTAATLDHNGQFTSLAEAVDDSDGKVWTAGKVFDVVIVDSDTDVAATRELFSSNMILVYAGYRLEDFEGANWQVVIVDQDEELPPVVAAHFKKDIAASNGIHSAPTVIVNATGEPTGLEICVQQRLESALGISVPIVGLTQVLEQPIPSKSTIISTIEAEKPLLRDVSESDLASIQKITDSASNIIWLTSNDALRADNPDCAPVSGLSRAVMLEQPALQFCVLAVDDSKQDQDCTTHNIGVILDDIKSGDMPDMEYIQSKGTLHVARWEPEEKLNEDFALRQNKGTIEVPLKKAGVCRLSIRHPGQFDSIHFVKDESKDLLPTDHVEIHVKCFGMNAKDLYVLGGKIDTKNVTCSCECAGIVTAVGDEVHDLEVGDRVVCMAPGHFGTFERLPHWAAVRLRRNETFADMCTVPIVYATAIYALQQRAGLQPDETVLIHSAAGGLGIAAIQVTQHIGAEIYCTVGNESKKKFLEDTFGIPQDHIFTSRDPSFLPALLARTSGRGVDVVLNSLTGELLHSSLDACANFGRFVEVGKRDIIDHGSLDMNVFKRNISFMAFDLADIFQSPKASHHKLWKQLLEQSLAFARSGNAQGAVPTKVFDVSQIVQAFKYFALGTRIGKVVVSMEDPSSVVSIVPSRHITAFDSEKTYLLVGCFGGLGRSMTKWMMLRGARKFIFLGRSGTTKSEARQLVDDLIAAGANVEVVRGDVANYADVEAAFAVSTSPIGGVVQAAMGLNEALFTSMSHKSWHTSIQPKVQGTWNLHNALNTDGRGDQLDFFLLTSSISGTVGTATESNYCSANAFLDAFARYRNSLGLPAVSVGLGMISEVGYLHEHPEIEKLLKRKGIHSINEDELLQIIDLALANQAPRTWRPSYDNFSNSHLLTGIEFIGLKQQRELGFEGDNHVLADPRASLFAAAFERSTADVAQGTVLLSHELPKEIKDALQAKSDITLTEAVTVIVKKKMANLILLPADKLQPEKKLGEFGLDSMLAAEFRTFVYHALEVDVPFMTLLDKTTSVSSLAALITEQMEEKMKEAS